MEGEGPAVSVVVLNWNGREHLAACLDSLGAIAFPQQQLEVIVVDNGSTDGSRELLREQYGWVRLIENPANYGYARANNQGAAAAQGRYVAFLNNDARVDRDWLRPLVEFLETRPAVALAGSLVLNWRGTKVDFMAGGMAIFGQGFQLGFKSPRRRAPAEPVRNLFVNGAGMLTRRDVFLEAGGFEERNFAYYEDADLGWRLWIMGYEVWLVPASVVYHRHNASQKGIPRERIELLFARNAMMSVIKNYEDEQFCRILPLALLREFKSLERQLGLDSRRFRLSEEDLVYQLGQTLPRDEARKRSAREFLAGLATGHRSLRVEVLSWLARRVVPGAAYLPPVLAARLMAMSDILDLWPELMEARRRVQAARKRPDSEILPLFHLEEQEEPDEDHPFASIEESRALARALVGAGLEAYVSRQ